MIVVTEGVTKSITEVELKYSIKNVLNELCVPVHLLGYNYLLDAVTFCIKDPSLLKCVTKYLYEDIAEKNNTSKPRVERAIRHAIASGMDKSREDIKYKYFYNSGKEHCTNTEFIGIISDRIKGDIELGKNNHESSDISLNSKYYG